MRILARTLDPSQPESGGLFVGDLIIQLLRRAATSVLPILPHLLKALATRLATAETASFSQSLILPFAYLMSGQMDTVLAHLETIEVPGSPPRSGLEILVTSWCENLDTLQGYWNIRVWFGGLRVMLSRTTSDLAFDQHGRLYESSPQRSPHVGAPASEGQFDHLGYQS